MSGPCRSHLCHLRASFDSPPSPAQHSGLSAHVLGSVSICLGSGDRKTWCVVISEAWQHGVGSYLGPQDKGLGKWWGLQGLIKNRRC